jgi:hypothetical protein
MGTNGKRKVGLKETQMIQHAGDLCAKMGKLLG